MDTLPPPPAFLSGILSFLLSFFALANNLLESENDEIPPPLLFLATVMNTFLILLPLLALFNQRNNGLIGRLFPHFRGIRNHGRDVWAVLERNPHIFWYCTGETPESLETVVENIFADVTSPRHLPTVPTSNRRRRCLLDVRNRVLLGFIWMRQYLKIHVLAFIFGISKSTVAEEIYHIVPILYVRYRHYILFPGHLNDASCYQRIPRIGRHRHRDLPRGARLLADGGYPARLPLIVPTRNPRNARQRSANRALRSLREERLEHHHPRLQSVFPIITDFEKSAVQLLVDKTSQVCRFLFTGATDFKDISWRLKQLTRFKPQDLNILCSSHS
ncbi:hypothetical protein ACROYT_G016065 [Oculina patagonica]